MAARFRRASRDDRLRFAQRTGVRYCFLPEPPFPGAPPLTDLAPLTGPMALYECGSEPRRVYVTSTALVEPDLRAQIDRLFDAGYDPYASVLLEAEPPAAVGSSGEAARVPAATVILERNTELLVRASVPAGGGYLNVLDTYDPAWRVEVDRRPATLLRANGLYRAVRLAPGTHEVRFAYRPMPFYAGLVVTLATAFALLAGCTREWRARRRRLEFEPAKAG